MKFLNNKSLFNILYLLSWIVNIMMIVIVLFTRSEYDLRSFFNSDIQFFPLFYQDVVLNGNSFLTWDYPGALVLFPDMSMYFIINTLTYNHLNITHLLYSIIQFSLMILCLNKIVKMINNDKYLIINTISNFLLVVFFFSAFNINNFAQFTWFIFIPNHHFGVFLASIWSFYFTLKFLNNGKYIYCWLTCVFSFLTTFSDRLYFVYYLVPLSFVFVLYFLKYGKNKISIRFFYYILTSGILGLLCFKSLSWFNILSIGNNFNMFEFNLMFKSLKDLFSLFKDYLLCGDYKSFIVFLFIVSSIMFIYRSICCFRQRNEDRMYVMFHFFFAIFILAVLFAPSINGNFGPWWTFRYNFYILLTGVFFIPLLCIDLFRINKIIVVISFFLFFMFTTYTSIKQLVYNKISPSYYLSFSPEWVKNVDSCFEQLGLKNGVATFWYANVYTRFSQDKTTCYAIYEDLQLRGGVSNKAWYLDSATRRCKHQPFNYIILEKGVDTTSVFSVFGKPLYRKDCGEVILYKVADFEYLNYKITLK